MNDDTSATAHRKPSAASPGLSAWWSPRRVRFWVLVAILAYTLFGFFAVPPLLKSMAVDALRESTGREASIGEVRFNPYVLSLEVNDFELQDPDGVSVAAFDQLFVNLQLSSLFRWAWTFREFRVDGLYYLYERFSPEDSRLTRLMTDIDSRSEPSDPEEQSAGLPRLLVHELHFGDGRVEFRDNVPPEAVDLELGPVSVSIQGLNTLPDRTGQQSVRIQLPRGAELGWQGDISLGPLRSEGRLYLRGSHLEQTTTYVKAVLPIETLEAVLSAETRYTVREEDDGSISVALDDLEAEISEVSATGLEPSTEFLRLQSFAIAGGSLRYPENRVDIAQLRIDGAVLETWLDEQGEPNLSQLAPGDPESAGSAPGADEAQEPWRIQVAEVVLADGRIGFTDRSIDPPAAVALQELQLSLQTFSNAEGAEFPLTLSGALEGGGAFGFEGRLAVLPDIVLAGNASASGIPLGLGQPYAQQGLSIRIDEGTLDGNSELELRPDATLGATGRFSVSGLSVNDTREDRALVGWERFETDRFELDTATSEISLSKLQFTKPFGRLVINADRTTNLSGLVIEEPNTAVPTEQSDAQPDAVAAAEAELAATPAPDYRIVIGGIEVESGSLNFSDLSLPLPFATEIHELAGTISTLDSQSAEPANVRMEGRVDDYGLARIQGALNLLDPISKTDIKMEFRNLLMSNLSPYTIDFAGREIDEGKLDLDLEYVLDVGQMRGDNKIVMSDLLLGDEVESPDAVSLPLDLAVALLKDSNGVIDIELPVEGDVNDPQFKIGGVIWQAFVGLVTKIVTAPFRLLGNLVGADSEDFGQFEFLAGRSDLAPPELEQIGLLQKALQERPELSVEIAGGYVAEVDIPALKFQRLRDEVLARVGDAYDADPDHFQMLDEALRSTLEALYTERFPETPLETMREAHRAPPASDPEGEPVFDALAYAADLRDRLLESEDIAPADLDTLANARAQAIADAFVADGAFDAGRVAVIEPKETESEDGEWVVMELGVGTN